FVQFVAYFYLLRQWVGPNLEFHDFARGSFAAFCVEGRTCRVGRIDGLSFPAGVRIIDATVDTLTVEAHRVRYSQREELTVDECEQSFGFIAGRQRNVFPDAKHVEPIDKVVVRRIGAGRVGGSLEVRAGECVEGPPFRAMLTGSAGSLQWGFALSPIE